MPKDKRHPSDARAHNSQRFFEYASDVPKWANYRGRYAKLVKRATNGRAKMSVSVLKHRDADPARRGRRRGLIARNDIRQHSHHGDLITPIALGAAHAIA